MVDFLLSYWWLIVLLFVVVALITRNLVKLMVGVVVILVLFVVFWEVFVAPGFSMSTQCFTDGAKLSEVNYQKVKTMVPGKERNKTVCLNGENSYKSLMSCFSASKKESNLSFAIYSSLPKFNRIIKENVDNHNQLCPNYPLVLPNF